MRRLSVSVTRTAICWILLELLAAAQIQSPEGPLLVAWLRVITLPITSSASYVADTTAHLATGIGDVTKLSGEVHSLREQLDQSHAKNILLSEQVRILSDAQELSLAVVPGFRQSTVARCIYRQLGEGRLRFNAGMNQGIHRDTIAVAAKGLVGRVTSADYSGCWVEMVTHPASAVAVMTEDSTVEGLASGDGRGMLVVEFVPHDAPLVRGALIVSSGADRTYPRGIPVGRVTSIRATGSAFLAVRAQPEADFSVLRVAVLVPSHEKSQQGGSPSSP
ncbi:MAG: rod shape-determining protein MreC [bacterium]|nr:rod shape-determining protein MreC [bacterium]